MSMAFSAISCWGAVFDAGAVVVCGFEVVQLLIFVEPDVQNLPIAYADTGMAALMALITIMTAKVLHLTLMVDSHFINGKEAEARTAKF